ncbi:uncharacterized protein si:ch211-126c2.4 isoform X2 [Conger conger]|uniref:uncharacterized protein si:ch211-126c2.4 isoform X2 n=1 Tax=Conger conger TaxID=82655 RepID=UPI002A5AB7E5|nr:uncharacterized protein si:ch211-126c2.4 isoform X2 [Conger conger]
MASCETSPSVTVCKPDVSLDGEVNTHPPKLDILAEEQRPDAPHRGEPVVEIDSGGGQDLSVRSGVLNLPSAALKSRADIQHEIQVGRANLRTFLTPSFKSLAFLSPIPEISPSVREAVHGKAQEEICASVMDEIQRCSYRTALQPLEGGGNFFGKSLNDRDFSMIEAESIPNLCCMDDTMEASYMQLDGEAASKLPFRVPLLVSLGKLNGGVEEGTGGEDGAKAAAERHSASPRCNSRKSLAPRILEQVQLQLLGSPGSAGRSGSSALNGTYNLSHCQGSAGGPGALEVQAGNVTVEVASGVGPAAKDVSSTQASTNNTLVLRSGTTLTGSDLTVDITENDAVGVIGLLRDDSKDALEMPSGEILTRPNLTIDIAELSAVGACLENSRKSLGSKNGTFEVHPDSAHKPVAAANRTVNLTVDLTPPNVPGSVTGSAEKRAGSQNVTVELQPGRLSEPAVGVNFTFDKSKQLDSEDDPAGVCAAEVGAEGPLGSFSQVGASAGNRSPGLDVEDSAGCSLWSLDSSLDSKANFLITSTPLVLPKVFSFPAKANPSDTCKRLSLVNHSEACSEGNPFCMSSDGNDSLASVQADQPPPAKAKPPTKSLTRPTGLPLKCDVKAPPPNRKSLAWPSGIPNPKSLHPLPRPSSSRLSLAPPPKTLAGPQAPGPQAPGPSSFLSSTLSRIGKKTGGALRNVAASGSLEASVGSTTSRKRHPVSENKHPVSGLQKPRTSGQPSSSGPSLLALRPTGQTVTRLQAQRAEAKGTGTLLPPSSLKQPRGTTEDTLPLSKRKKVDALAHATSSEAPGSSAGSQPGLRRPATRLRGPQSKLQNLGGGQISGALITKKSGPTAPLHPEVQPAQDAPPTAVSGPCEDDPGLANRGAGTPGADCENCEKYRQEIARLRAELEERDQRNA